MDQFGDLLLSWSFGYDGSSVFFLDNNEVVFVNGNCLKFVNLESNGVRYLALTGDGIHNLTVNNIYGFFAFSDNGMEAKILIYHVEDLTKPKAILKGSGNCLGYKAVSLANNRSLLISCSDIPEFKLTLWNWVEGQELYTVGLHHAVNKISFNPINWKQVCSQDESGVMTIWEIEKVNESYFLQRRDLTLPRIDGTFGLEDVDGEEINDLSSYHPTTGHHTLNITKSAIAGIVRARKDNFVFDSEVRRCVPLNHCWAPNNHLYCGTVDGMLLSIDTETQNVSILSNENTENPQKIFMDNIVLHKDSLFVSGRSGNLYCLKITPKDTFKIVQRIDVGKAISCMTFSLDYNKLLLGSSLGCIYTYQKESGVKTVLEDNCSGSVVGIDNLCGGNQYFVIGRSEGLLQVWKSKSPMTYVSQINLRTELMCIASPPACCAVYAGTQIGSVVVVDFFNISKPNCVYELQLHKGPVTFIRIDETGTLMVTSSTDGYIFFLNAKISSKLQVLGYISIPGTVQCLSLRSLNEHGSSGPWKILAGLSTGDHIPGCNQMLEMKVTDELLKGVSSLYMDSTRLLKDVSLSKKTYILKTFIHDICVVTDDLAIGIVHNGNRIAKFNLNLEQETPSPNIVLDASFTYPGHGLPGGRIALSCHGKWIVTGSPDGHMILRAVGAMSNVVCIQAGNYREGGLKYVCFTADAQTILTVSETGVVSGWKWQYSSLGKSKATIAIETFRSRLAEVKAARDEEDTFISSMPSVDMKTEAQITWLEDSIQKARKKEDEKFTTTKTDLRNDINKLKTKVLSLMSTNEKVPDIEKLDRHEFNMDIEERNALLQDREKLLKELRSEVELKDTAQQYLWHLIKSECWDKMSVKGRCVKGFNNDMEVSNYPMRERSAQEMEELNYVSQLRRIEEIDTDTRRQTFPSINSAFNSLLENTFADVDDDSTDTEQNSTKDYSATHGSLGYKYGGDNSLLQSQFTLHSKTPKRFQIVLLQDCIYNVKLEFNKFFTDVYNAKLQEMKRIGDRNERIKKIMSDLNVYETLLTVDLSESEEPERILKVEDHEIPFEKYISEEERARMEEEARVEEERRLAENVDNLRGRALDMMMAGRLETGMEEELKKNIEKPEFIESKPQDKWNEEEQKLAKEYEKAKSQLAEEQDKYRKSLELEMKKLQLTNTDATVAFDDRLNQLFQRKIKTEAVILQEELKIVRLAASILTEEELESAELELVNKLEQKKEEKQQSSLTVGDARRDVDAFRDSYEMLVANDKTLDKMFRKEFSDLDQHTIDVLYRLFKKRPRAQRTLKAAVDTQHEDSAGQNIEGSPFQVRPSSSCIASSAMSSLEKSLQELDSEQHKPENVTTETWNHLIDLRRNKIEKEQQLKSKALVLADMNAFLQKKIDKDEELKQAIEKTFEDIQRLRDERLKYILNLEVQLLLKQGQIEVGKCNFVPDYTDSLLIHRSAVERLNAVIKTLGESKLASMRESKEFRKGIHLLAWELKEMYMRAEDFQTTALDLQLLHVTKDLQAYLSDTDQRQSEQHEISTLEKTIEACKKMHERQVNGKKRSIRKLKRQIKEKSEENKTLDIQLEDLALNVAERKNIDKVNDDQKPEAASKKRMQDIITRRKLVDLAKAQASEIGMLRAEVERLRMRTFPALVQVEGK